MKISYNWLKTYIDFPYSPEKLSKKLTMAGLEVEEMNFLGQDLEEIIVGKVLEVKEHPNADKLVICNVDVGKEELQLITGAPNVKEGIKVPVAKSGVTLPTGLEIEESELRGKVSAGMICSKDELGLVEERQSGIMVLDDELEVGNKFINEYGLNDYVYKLDLTPNYARCLGMLGIAREIKAMLAGEKEVKFPEIDIKETEENVKDYVNIKVDDKDLCPRYTGKIIKDVTIKPSPKWMQNRLKAAGIRPINNIVDITNYVLLEYNQPLHAFDYDKIAQNTVIVRRANKDEELITLDDEKRNLNENTLLITDEEKILGLAGVMGGKVSEVTEKTKNIFLESAYFDPLNIRKTSSDFGIHSEASHRFEREIDIERVVEASNRAAYLMQEYADGKIVKGVIDKYPEPYQEKVIELESERVNKILGLSLSNDQIKNMLKNLEFNVEIYENSGLLKVKVPSYRTDVEQKADLIEEVARMYGYNNIPTTTPERRQQGHRTEKQKIQIKIKDILTAGGLNEIKTFSLMDKKAYDKLQINNEDDLRNWVKIKNPLNKAFEIMRTTLIPGTVEVLSNNNKRQLSNMAVFEIGRIYKNTGKNKRPFEEKMITGGSMGIDIKSWNNSAPDFFYLKGVLEELFQRLNIEVQYEKEEKNFLHPGRTALIKSGKEKIGFIGELNYEVIDEYDLVEGTTIFELNFDKMLEKIKEKKNNYQPLPKFPAVNRDLAIVLDKDVPVSEIEKIMKIAGGSLLEDIDLFDLYEGDQIAVGKKSLAFNLKFRSTERTLRDEEVNEVFNNILEDLTEEVGAEIRGK
ncbi:MAG TPA: phenylalanine--tRNA ligase subunit beta [Halanaerobiales bacterium]|nr:phenylalanine--tRNA ligase subunit beta [Halanaerobiales bacterium]